MWTISAAAIDGAASRSIRFAAVNELTRSNFRSPRP
jgi:hypothetical protein